MRSDQLSLCCLLLVFLACKPKERTVEVTVPGLPVYALYEADTVVGFLGTVDEDGRKLSTSYLGKARDIKEKNREMATYYYKRSLSVYPEYDVYLEFRKHLEEAGNYRELDKLYGLLFATKYIDNEHKYILKTPDFQLLIDYAVNFTQLGDIYYDELLWHADKLGFEKKKVREALLKDGRIPYEKNSQAFRLLEMNFMEEEEYEAYMKSDEFREFFIHSFEAVTDKWIIDEAKVAEFSYNSEENYYEGEGLRYRANFFDVLPCTEEGDFLYNLGCRLLLNSRDIAVIYSVDASATACPKDMRFVTHYIAFYDSNHVFQSCYPVAWQNDTALVTAELNGREVTQEVYKRTWEKPFNRKEFDNRLLANIFVGTRHPFFDDFAIRNKFVDHTKKMVETR